MATFWTNLISQLGAFGIAVVGLLWFSQKLIKEFFQMERKNFQKEVDKELKKFQTELEKEKIKFSGIQDKRAEKIEEFYSHLIDFEEDLRSLVKPFQGIEEQSQDEKLKEVAESGENFRKFYEKNKIYFSEETQEDIENLKDEMRGIFDDFNIFRIHDRDDTPLDEVERTDTWVEDWNSLDEGEISELKQDLENSFREILGVK